MSYLYHVVCYRSVRRVPSPCPSSRPAVLCGLRSSARSSWCVCVHTTYVSRASNLLLKTCASATPRTAALLCAVCGSAGSGLSPIG